MKIRRPSSPEVPFKRRRSPPPQATKLLTYSLAAGIVFMVLLAIVFLPRMFPDQTPIEIVRSFHFESQNGTQIYIDSVTVSLELSRFRANFSVDGVEMARLGPGLGGGNATFRFVDGSPPDGLLDSGDYFQVSQPPIGCYRLEIFQLDVGRLTGSLTWGACP
ncbi:MAG: hypothetical protein E6K04_00475 [Methanobacteriota archaeon]|nr:MAG: hypothetical protein E6K04_00475 [Euryarchaeota archaeon]